MFEKSAGMKMCTGRQRKASKHRSIQIRLFRQELISSHLDFTFNLEETKKYFWSNVFGEITERARKFLTNFSRSGFGKRDITINNVSYAFGRAKSRLFSLNFTTLKKWLEILLREFYTEA